MLVTDLIVFQLCGINLNNPPTEASPRAAMVCVSNIPHAFINAQNTVCAAWQQHQKPAGTADQRSVRQEQPTYPFDSKKQWKLYAKNPSLSKVLLAQKMLLGFS